MLTTHLLWRVNIIYQQKANGDQANLVFAQKKEVVLSLDIILDT